jgi:HD-like signal output (HDOD) protein
MLINAFEDMDLQDRTFVHQVWEHTLLTANFTKIFAYKEPISKQDDLFLAGMIHDVGYIVLREYFGKKYQVLMAKKTFPSVQDEDALLGVNHVMIGTALLKEWHFPEEVNELVRCQHKIDSYMGNKREIALLVASDELASQKNLRHFFLKEETQVDKEELKTIQLAGWDWPQLKSAKDKFLNAEDMTHKLFAGM